MASTPPRPRRWIAVFVFLAALAGVAIVVPIVYNLGLQLRPEQLARARARWEEAGPRDYDLHYMVKTDQDPEPDEYLVQVRAGKVVLVGCNGEVVLVGRAVGPAVGLAVRGLRADSPRNYGVEAMFRQIEADLSADAAAGGRNFATALFDARDGHPVRYVHRVRGTSRRVEWNVRLDRFKG